MTSNLDIVLVHPNASNQIYQELSDSFSAIEPPIWASMLSKALQHRGHSCEVLDCEALGLTYEEAGERIHAMNPRLVAVVVYGQQPSASTQNMIGAINTMRKIRDLPRIYVGAHPSALPKRTLLDDWGSLVCQGEGLETLHGLLKHGPTENKKYDRIPGLWWYDSFRSEVKHTDQAPLITNLDEDLPGMDWGGLPMDNYRTSNWHSWSNDNERQPFASLYTSLGCPYKCTFCMINAPFGKAVFRHWSPEFILKQFDKIADMGITNVKIADELFVLKPKHFMTVCDLLIKRGHKFNIWAYSRIDTVKKKYLETLRKAGVNWLALGIESANTTVRRDVVKGKFEDVNIRQVVQEIKDEGINVIGNFILGLPEDNYDTMQETLSLAKELQCEMLNIYSAMAYPGSKLHDMAVAEGKTLPASWVGYSQHAYETRPLDTNYVSGGEVLSCRDKAFHEYFNDEKYLDYMRSKFGEETVEGINKMKQHVLKREILEL